MQGLGRCGKCKNGSQMSKVITEFRALVTSAHGNVTMSLLFYILEMSGRIGAIHSAETYSPYTTYSVAYIARQCDDVDSLANETMNEIFKLRICRNCVKYFRSKISRLNIFL